MLKYPKQVIQLYEEHRIVLISKYLLISKEVSFGNFRNFLLLLIIFSPKNHFTLKVENQKEQEYYLKSDLGRFKLTDDSV